MVIDISFLGTVAGSLMAIITLIAFFVKPVINANKNNQEQLAKINAQNSETFANITETLSKVNYNLDLLSRDLTDGKTDREQIHEQLDEHEDKLHIHDQQLVKHGEQLKTLFKERNK